MQIFFSLQEKLYVTPQVIRFEVLGSGFKVGFLIFAPLYIHRSLTPRPDLAYLSHWVETYSVAFSEIVPGMHIKSRQGRRGTVNLRSLFYLPVIASSGEAGGSVSLAHSPSQIVVFFQTEP
jgi:hypothetical protein